MKLKVKIVVQKMTNIRKLGKLFPPFDGKYFFVTQHPKMIFFYVIHLFSSICLFFITCIFVDTFPLQALLINPLIGCPPFSFPLLLVEHARPLANIVFNFTYIQRRLVMLSVLTLIYIYIYMIPRNKRI